MLSGGGSTGSTAGAGAAGGLLSNGLNELLDTFKQNGHGETAQSWFSGMNPWLDDEAPAYVLRHSNEADAWESVVEAAEEFVEFER